MLLKKGLILIALFSFYWLTFLISQCAAQAIFYPPKSENDLIGHFTYEIPPNSWLSKFRRHLPQNKNFALEFRKSKNYKIVLLLKIEETRDDCQKEYESCFDRIVAAIKLPKYSNNEAAIFHCRIKNQEPRAEDAYFGIAQNSKTAGYFVPKLAWHVNLMNQKIEPIDNKLIECKLCGED